MRIFNWVHRRLIPKDGLGQQNLRKDDQVILSGEAETKALLEENINVSAPAGMLHYRGWNGGILSIGTFGLLKDDLSIMINNGEHKEYFGFIDKDEQDQEKWEESQEAEEYCHQGEDEWEDDNTMGTDGEDYQDSDVEGEWNPLLYDSNSGGGAPRTITINPDDDQSITSVDAVNDSVQYYEEVHKKRGRITLADLFSAESEDDEDGDHDGITRSTQKQYYCSKVPPKSKYPINKKPASITSTGVFSDAAQKNGLVFAKKLIPKVKEDGSRPIQKLQGLMKRMLKRKIHPDINVEAKIIKPCAADFASSN